MTNDYIYIFTNPISNQVQSLGVGLKYFTTAVTTLPNHLLLIKNPKNLGRFDEFSRFHIVSGTEEVKDFIETQEGRKQAQTKWIDFKYESLFQQLSDQEIAELLFLGHTDSPLNQPTFYKLGNRYTFFGSTYPNSFPTTKMYYRDIHDFFKQLGYVLAERVAEDLKEQKPLFVFRKKTVTPPSKPIPIPSKPILSHLAGLSHDGIAITFEGRADMGPNQRVFHVYLAEDNPRFVEADKAKQPLFGTLIYDVKEGTWNFEA
ncbi:hypothetical protein EF384_05845 [Aerococcus agrisoli]|uniref:Uncharacterized protein n=1 Tax=Aerococcus agrisoli TaxID=2487350 RepID=A0A3N4GMR2_9LACT|nr:hypothetical protein [Aerococcus agrisoli]RPA60421.1 hypothetical protein EF384_05845 [Aerococcus agrisoli]